MIICLYIFPMSVENTYLCKRNRSRVEIRLLCTAGPLCRMSLSTSPDDGFVDGSKTTRSLVVHVELPVQCICGGNG